MSDDKLEELDDDKPFAKEGYALMAAAFEVHREIRGGLGEEVYQESLEEELRLRGVPFVAKAELEVFYKGKKLKKRYVPDLYAFDEIVVELKSVSSLLPEHIGQLMNYMRIARKPVGYLINFGPLGKVEWKRFVLREFVQKPGN